MAEAELAAAAEEEEEEPPPPPDDLRCRRSDGRGWRCKRAAISGFSNCEHHLSAAQRRRLLSGQTPLPRRRRPALLHHLDLDLDLFHVPIPKKKRLPRLPLTLVRVPQDPTFPTNPPPNPSETTVAEQEEEDPKDPTFEEVPDDLRCRRTDGKQWRCRRRAMDNHYYCELHCIQAFRRQHRLGVPDSLKLRRGRPAKKRKRREGEQKEEEEEEEKDKTRRKKKRGGERPLETIVRMVMSRKKDKFGNVEKAVESDAVSNLWRIDERENVPEHLRCRRTDGKRWRCSRRALDNLSFCEIHHIQAYRRQYKLGVPESLKLKRRPRGSVPHARRIARAIGKRREVFMRGEGLRRAVKMEKRRKGNEELLVEVMRMVLEKQVDRRRREERAAADPEFVKKALPNGVMTISPAAPGSSHGVGRHLDMKIGLDSSSFLRWCFRSKNVDTPPVESLQTLPYARRAVGLGKRRRRVCHHCRTSPVGRILRCSCCRKAFFCKSCIKKWYSELSESDVRMSCPICRRKCRCAVCMSSKPKDQSS